MSNLVAKFQKYQEQLYDNGGYPVSALDLDLFKSALTEVLKLVEVTDEEIEKEWEGRIPKAAVQWSRDLSKTKLEKLIG